MFLKAFSQTLFISAIFFIFHLLISFLIGTPTLIELIIIHSVLFALTFGGYALLLLVNKIDSNKLGFAFLAISTIKMLIGASIVLLLIKGLNKPSYVAIHFISAYLFYLFFLSFKVFSLLKSK